MIEHFRPASSNIEEAVYDSEAKELKVSFQTGNSYLYSNVPQDAWFGLQHSPSAGSYFWRNIRQRYPYQQVS